MIRFFLSFIALLFQSVCIAVIVMTSKAGGSMQDLNWWAINFTLIVTTVINFTNMMLSLTGYYQLQKKQDSIFDLLKAFCVYRFSPKTKVIDTIVVSFDAKQLENLDNTWIAEYIEQLKPADRQKIIDAYPMLKKSIVKEILPASNTQKQLGHPSHV